MFKKKLIAAGIAAVFTLSSFTTTVFAADFSKSFTGETVKLTNPGKGNGNGNVQSKDIKTIKKLYKFTDSKDVSWALNAIEKLAGKGIINGIGYGKFAPNNKVTHLEALAMVFRLTGDDTVAESLNNQVHALFKGKKTVWGQGYINLAIEKEILLEEELEDFNPNTPAKRVDIAKYIIRALGETEEALDNMDADLDFKDSKDIPEDSVGYVYMVSKLKIMIGDKNNKFNPNTPVTRAEMAVLLDRAEGQFDIPDTDRRKSGIVFVSADEDDNEINVKIKGISYTYEYLDDVNVYKDGEFADIEDLEAGDVLQLVFNSSKKVIFIEVVKNVADEVSNISFSEVAYKNLPETLQDEIDDLKAKENYKAYKYNGYIYLLATMGKKSTGGYDIDIEKLSKALDGDEYTITAVVDTDEPSSGSVVTQSVTYPYSVVRFKSFDDIENVVFVDGDDDELEDADIEELDEVTSVEGEIYDLISSSRKIKIEKSNGVKVSYTIPSDAEIQVNDDDDARFSDLEEGMSVKLEITDGEVTEVIAEDAEADEVSFKVVEYNNLAARLKDQVDHLKLTKNYKAYEYDDYVYLIATMGKKTSDGYDINIENIDKVKSGSKYIVEAEVAIDTPSSSSSSKTVYPYTVARFSSFSNISSIVFQDEDGDELAEVKIVKLDEVVEVKGTIDSINTSKETINVKKSNGSVVTLTIPDDAEISVNDEDDEDFSALEVGMNVEVEMVDETVTKVVAEDKKVEVKGELTGISISTVKRITLDVDGRSKTYTVDSDVEIILDDDDARVEDLKIGDQLTLTFVNGLLVEIEG